MSHTDVLTASGLPACWAAEYAAIRPAEARALAVRHTRHTVARMPAVHRHLVALALRSFPVAFYAVTRRRPRNAPPEVVREGMTRLRRAPGYAQLLRATTALALYGALDGARDAASDGGVPYRRKGEAS
ncbi:hypothetical protein AB0N81_23440 [Streptomyces sp. NPDC093510]|uniref:hypothetical protein n=1 Tax=Streptomyces sp. NPDC093510 TaxID=3155199 RepID=UPI0034332686